MTKPLNKIIKEPNRKPINYQSKVEGREINTQQPQKVSGGKMHFKTDDFVSYEPEYINTNHKKVPIHPVKSPVIEGQNFYMSGRPFVLHETIYETRKGDAYKDNWAAQDGKNIDFNVNKTNRIVTTREMINRYSNKTMRMIQAPVDIGKRAMSVDDEDENAVGARIIKDKMGYASGLLNMGDADSMDKLDRIAKQRMQRAQGGDRIKEIMYNGKLSGHATVGASDTMISNRFLMGDVTVGDYSAFRAAGKNPSLTTKELLQIRNQSNAKAVNNGREMRLNNKKVSEMKNAYLTDQAEHLMADYAKKNRGKFSDRMYKILSEENAIFKMTSKDAAEMQKAIITVLSDPSFSGKFAKLNFAKMDIRDLKRILASMDNKQARSLANLLLDIKKTEKAKDKIRRRKSSRGSVKSKLMHDMGIGMLEKDETFSSSMSVISRTVQATKYATSATLGTAKLGEKLIEKSISVGAKGTEAGLRLTGHTKAAENIRTARMSARDIKAASKSRVDAIKNAPRAALNRLKGASGRGLKTAFTYIPGVNRLMNSAFYKYLKFGGNGIRNIGRGIKKVTLAPFKTASAVTNVVKKKLLMPVVLVVGGLCLIIFLGAGLFGAGGSASTVPRTVILDSEENLADLQAQYTESEATFMAQVDSIINGFASTLNKKGNQIHYGVNGGANEGEGNVNSDYENGVTLNFYRSGQLSNFESSSSSNIEDLLCVLAVIMGQSQEINHIQALELMDALYKTTHTYDYQESALYPCASGCETTHYNCNEYKLDFPNSDLRFHPWKYTDEDLESVISNVKTCVVCEKNPDIPFEEKSGCVAVGVCYHGASGNMGDVHIGCDNYEPVYDCPGHEHSHTSTDADGNETEDTWTSYCSNDIGCEGYYQCNGHDHYGCPDGHDIHTCYGHVNLTMNVYMIALEDIFNNMVGGVEPVENQIASATEGGEENEE